jgi:two-component system, NarL family, nitrate/nitrite response regulator NarL
MTEHKQRQSFSLWLIDDEREIYAAMLPGIQHEKEIKKFRWFPGCQPALEAVRFDSPPDILLLDVNLGGMNGVDAIPLFQSAIPATKIIMLTIERRTDNVLRAATSGVGGYLLKPFRIEDVVTACHRALAGGIPFDPDVTAQLIREIPHPYRSLNDYRLTTMEQRVVQGVVKGLTNVLIGDSCGVGEETIKTHLKKIFCKLGVHSKTQLTAKILSERLL